MAVESNDLYDLMNAKVFGARRKHARHLQEKDYSHVFRKKSFFEILKLSALAIGIGVVYAAETAFVSPTLLEIGVDYATMTMIWGLSPVIGLLLGPFFGSISDRCRLSLGRRRPMILFLSLTMIIGLICLAFGRNIGKLFGDGGSENIPVIEVNNTISPTITTLTTGNRPNLKFTVILTILGVMLMDFASETCQSPARAFMLDVCVPEDHNRVLSTFSVMTGLGSTLAYAIGGIDWASTALGQSIGGDLQTVFTIDGLLLVVCFCITFFSFREIPLPLIEKTKLIQSGTVASIENEFSTNNINKNHNPSSIDNSAIDQSPRVPEGFSVQTKSDNIINDEEVKTVSLGRYLKSIVVMPKSLTILCLTNLLSWMAHICYCLYFTDFVGQEVFHGDPTAPVMTQEYNLYEEGVRFGGLGMAVYSFSSSIYSFIINKLMLRFKPKYVYIFGIMMFAFGMFILAAWPTKLGVLFLSITAGIIYGTINTIPFIIVANYHVKGCFKMCNGEIIPLKEPRGLGTDIAIISSMLFVAQLVLSFSIGFLVSWAGTTSAIFYASSGFSVCAAVSAFFVLYV